MRYRIGKRLAVKFMFIYYTRKWIFLLLFVFSTIVHTLLMYLSDIEIL